MAIAHNIPDDLEKLDGQTKERWMKTTEEMQAFVDDIRAVCERHGVFIIGTCKSAGIYGEITIFESGREPEAWLRPDQQLTNEVEKYEKYYQVCGIGDYRPARI